MRPLTLRTKLTLFYSITVSVLLTGFALIYYRVLTVEVENLLAQDILDRTSGLRGYLRFEEGQPVFIYDESDPDEVTFISRATRYYQVYDVRTGTLLKESELLQASQVRFSAADIDHYATTTPAFIDIHTDLETIRLRNETVSVPGGNYLLFVGTSMQPLEDTTRSFLQAFSWLLPSGVLLAALASWFMAGKALEPVAALGKAASEIVVSRLDRRLPVQGTNDELDQLAIQFNETLARLEKAVDEMKQFTASISHELRTPLAILRGEAEVALMQTHTPEQYRRVLASQLEEFEKLTRMINQLLTLARAESGEVEMVREPVNVSTMVQTLTEDLEPVAASKQVKLTCSCDRNVTVSGDSGWIERIVLNLLDNAIKFTRPGGHVRVSVSNRGPTATLEVEDDGIGIPSEAIPHIFERFYRSDPSRSNRSGGAGLGLSLVKWAVDQHRGSIEVESTAGSGSRFRVHLPSRIINPN
jgi:two-component system OmpR family sensor kinase